MRGHGMHDMWPGAHPAVRGLRIAGLVVLGVIGAALFALVFGWLVMILWNWLMPAIFHLGEIGYWQAFGIVILAKLIFGGIGGARYGGRGHNPWKGRTAAGGTTGATTGSSGKPKAGMPSSASCRKKPENPGLARNQGHQAHDCGGGHAPLLVLLRERPPLP